VFRGTLRSQPSTSSFLVAGKREPHARLRTRQLAIPPNTLHDSTSTFAFLLLSFVSLFTLCCRPLSDDIWVRQAFVPPTTRPHCHQNSPGDRSSASLEYLHSYQAPETNTLPCTQLPLPLHQRIGHHTVRHYNDTLSARSPHKYPPSAFHLKTHSLPSTLKQLLSQAVDPSNWRAGRLQLRVRHPTVSSEALLRPPALTPAFAQSQPLQAHTPYLYAACRDLAMHSLPIRL